MKKYLGAKCKLLVFNIICSKENNSIMETWRIFWQMKLKLHMSNVVGWNMEHKKSQNKQIKSLLSFVGLTFIIFSFSFFFTISTFISKMKLETPAECNIFLKIYKTFYEIIFQLWPKPFFKAVRPTNRLKQDWITILVNSCQFLSILVNSW